MKNRAALGAQSKQKLPRRIEHKSPLVQIAVECLVYAFHGSCTGTETRDILQKTFLVPNTAESFEYIRQVRELYNSYVADRYEYKPQRRTKPGFEALGEDISACKHLTMDEITMWILASGCHNFRSWIDPNRTEGPWADVFGENGDCGFRCIPLFQVLIGCRKELLEVAVEAFERRTGMGFRKFIVKVSFIQGIH